MRDLSPNAKIGHSRRQMVFRLLFGIFIIFAIFAYLVWQFEHRYQVESEVLNGYKNDNRELLVVLDKEIENEAKHWNWGRANQIAKTLADRLRQRGYSVQRVESETLKGRSLREKVEEAAASTSDTYSSGETPLTSQVLDRAAQVHAGVLRVYLNEVVYKRSNDVISETYGLELSNPDNSPAWKATLKYQYSLGEDFVNLLRLFRHNSGNPAHWREEALTDMAIERMQQQGVLK